MNAFRLHEARMTRRFVRSIPSTLQLLLNPVVVVDLL